MTTICKAFVFSLLIFTALAFPQEDEYDGFEYEEQDYSDAQVPEFMEQPQTIVAKEGESAEIPCNLQMQEEMKGKNPFVLIIKKLPIPEKGQPEKLLYVGGVRVPRERRYKNVDGKVEILNLKREDAGPYLCRIEAEPPVEVTHILDIQYSPVITDITKSDEIVHQGGNVKLECAAEGNPIPTIKWSRENAKLPSGYEEVEGYSITLTEVNRHTEGTYVCTADNGIGNAVSHSMPLQVQYRPEVRTDEDIVRNDEGDTIELTCTVHARPMPEIEWLKDGLPIKFDSHIEVHDAGHRSSVKINQITENDFGEYTCSATNTYGYEESVISLSGNPKIPIITSDENGGEETTYTLTWTTESFYPITNYRLKYRKAKANDSTDVPGDWTEQIYEVDADHMTVKGLINSMKHKIENLEGATDYNASVQVKNQYMWSDSVDFSFSTRKEMAQPTRINGATSVGFSVVLLTATAILLRT